MRHCARATRTLGAIRPPVGAALAYNPGFDFTIKEPKIMEAERTNALSALLADLTIREAELRRYL